MKLKLTDDQVVAIRDDQRPGKMIANHYGISHGYVSQLKSGLWRRNAGTNSQPHPITAEHVDKSPNICGLSDEDILQIVYSDEPIRQLARRYDVSQGSVRRIFIKFDKELPNLRRKRLTGMEIEEIYTSNRLQPDLAKEYGVTQSYISQVKNGKNAYVKKHQRQLEEKYPRQAPPVTRTRKPSHRMMPIRPKSANAWRTAFISMVSFLSGGSLIATLIYVAGLMV